MGNGLKLQGGGKKSEEKLGNWEKNLSSRSPLFLSPSQTLVSRHFHLIPHPQWMKIEGGKARESTQTQGK